MISLEAYRVSVGLFNSRTCRKSDKGCVLQGDEISVVLCIVFLVIFFPILVYAGLTFYVCSMLFKCSKDMVRKICTLARLLTHFHEHLTSISYFCLCVNVKVSIIFMEYTSMNEHLCFDESGISVLATKSMIMDFILAALTAYILVSISECMAHNSSVSINLRGGGDPQSSSSSGTQVNYTFTKITSGSFNQADLRFREVAGIQCGVNVIYAICFGIVKKVSSWTSTDLDFILTNGSDLFKELGFRDILALDELPLSVEIFDKPLTLQTLGEIGTTYFGQSDNYSKVLGEQFVRMIRDANVKGAACVTNGITFAIIKESTNYYIFDSHARSSVDGQRSENGTSIVIKFKNMTELANYIKSVYLGRENNYMQIQLFGNDTVEENLISIRNVLRQQQKNTSSNKRYQEKFKELKKQANKEKYSSIVGTPEHDEVKSKMKCRYARNKDVVKEKYVQNKPAIQEKYVQNKPAIQEKYVQNKPAIQEKYSSIVGTPEHDEVKSKMKCRYARNKDVVKEKYVQNKPAIQEKYVQNKEAIREKYQTNRDTISQRKKRTYAEMQGTEIHENIKTRMRQRYDEQKENKDCVQTFIDLVKEGPCYICVSCNRCLYKKSVKKFKENKYPEVENFSFSHVAAINETEYICHTCDKHLMKCRMPPQAVSNDLEIFYLPNEFANLGKLEKALCARRILFKKVLIMPRGQFGKLKGKICNVPLETVDVTDTLPRANDSNSIVIIKFKRKTQYKSDYMYEPVRPEQVVQFLEYLKVNNHLYNDIEISRENIDGLREEGLLYDSINSGNSNDNNDHVNVDLQDESQQDDEFIDFTIENVSEIPNVDNENNANSDDDSDPLSESRVQSSETALINQRITDEMIIAPCEGKTPIAIYDDPFCEELAHPHLFPTGKFGYKVERDIVLTPVRYFNQRLLNYTQRFASDNDYIFFAQMITQEIRILSRINIAMKKVRGNITAGMLVNDYDNTVNMLLRDQDAYKFLNEVKGSPSYWKVFLYEVLAMIRQLGVPTFFLTLSCADLHWDELIKIILKLQKAEMSDEDINNLSYIDRCKILNSNPILLARHFQYRLEMFFKEIIIDGPLGKTTYYAIRIEFQLRGSPHSHNFLWILGAPTLSKDNIPEYITFIDGIIKASLPEKDENPELFELVKTYQIHSHTKSCKKYRNKKCRYNFGRFFTDRTIIAQPLPNDMSVEERETKLKWKANVLKPVKEYIDEYLNPRKVDIYADAHEVPSILEILQSLEIDYDDYIEALSISSCGDSEIHYKRAPNSCFVNNYFIEGLQAWKGNLDIQPVLSTYATVNYLASYMSKQEDEVSDAMSEAAKTAKEMNLNKFEQMKLIARAYSTHREVSVQEAAYHILPELFLRKTYPKVEFANSNLPEDRVRMCLSREELAERDEGSTDIFQQSAIDSYIIRPPVVRELCFAEFLSNYEARKMPDQNDSQPVELTEELLDVNHAESSQGLPRTLNLSNKKTWKRRKVKKVLRFHRPNPTKYPEKYAHHLLFLYYPFENESDLAINGSYCTKLQDQNCLDIVNRNKAIFEPAGELLDDALLNFRDIIAPDPIIDYENDQTDVQLPNLDDDDDDDTNGTENTDDRPYSCAVTPSTLPDAEINSSIRLLNKEQREVFEVIHEWAKKLLKNLNCVKPEVIKPLYLFITGNAGTGKSFLLNTAYEHLTKLFSFKNSAGMKVLRLAPTGVSAIKIRGETYFSALHIPIKCKLGSLPKLSSKQLDECRRRFSEVNVVFLDEISFVDFENFEFINQRLNEIFGCPSVSYIFANLTFIVAGDFLQLPPIKGIRVYGKHRNPMYNVHRLWDHFIMAELTTVVRQDDMRLINLLNNCRIGKPTDADIELLKSRHVDSHPDYPTHIMHIFAENSLVSAHNEKMLAENNNPLVTIAAIDKLSPDTSEAQKERCIRGKSQMQLGGLATVFEVKLESNVMLTQNVDVADRLANGQTGIVRHIKFNPGRTRPKAIYVSFDDVQAGINARRSDQYANTNQCVPLTETEARVQLGVNFRRKQFPLMLANSCTVHKVQGLEFASILVSFQLAKQRQFNAGQQYVALSRVKSLDGLYTAGEIKKSHIRADSAALEEYERLHIEAPLVPIKRFENSNSSLIIGHFNVRSFFAHTSDIMSDHILLNCDLMVLSETQIKKSDVSDNGLTPLSRYLDGYNIFFQNEEDKFLSLAVCCRPDLEFELKHSLYNMPGVMLFSVRKPLFSLETFNVLLVYRKNGSPRQVLRYVLEGMISYYEVDLILGDFNLDGMVDNILGELSDYKQLISHPTQISGGLLDHVYVRKTFSYRIESLMKHLYFSDHDATIAEIK